MKTNNLIETTQQIMPSQQERFAAVLMYFCWFLGDIGIGFFAALGIISSTTDLSPFLQFHQKQSERNGLFLALPSILFIAIPLLIDMFVFKLNQTVFSFAMVIAGLLFLGLIIVDLLSIFFAAKGKMRQILPW